MTIPWIVGPPTPEQVAAHAKVHPVGDDCGLWRYRGNALPGYCRLRVMDSKVCVFDPSVVDGYYWQIVSASNYAYRWLAVTAEGVPVDYEALRAKVERLRVNIAVMPHYDDCPFWGGRQAPDDECNCGVTELLEIADAELMGGNTILAQARHEERERCANVLDAKSDETKVRISRDVDWWANDTTQVQVRMMHSMISSCADDIRALPDNS